MQLDGKKPVALNWRRSAIEAFAEAITSNVALNVKPGEPLEKVVTDLGGKIAATDVWTNPDAGGSLVVNKERDFWIVLPTHTSARRDRFTIAHELGHYFLHFLTRTPEKRSSGLVAYRYGSDRVEWEANWFAAAFLMRKDVFCQKHGEFGGDVELLSSFFDVSEQSCRVRAKTLGLEGL